MESLFKCGHATEVKFTGFGRGAARERRIAEYLNRPCFNCAWSARKHLLDSLTDMQGNPRPTSLEQREEHFRKLASSY